MPENGPAGNNSPTKLNGWKEIASYFGKEVRTVQNWEKDEGMPVYRHKHLHRSSVYAYPAELDHWWKTKGSALPEKPPPPSSPDEISASWKWPAPVALSALLVGVVVWAALKIPRTEANPVALAVIPFASDRPQSKLQLPVFGDLDGDGRDDAVLSDLNARAVYIKFGARILQTGALLPREADVVLRTEENADFLAQMAADVNGDGIRDLILSDVLREPDTFRRTGPSYIVYGRKRWPPSLTVPQQADVILQGPADKEIRMVACSLSAGEADLNKDGIADVILGATDYSPLGRASAGGVFVLFGRSNWARTLDVAAVADISIHGSRIGEGLTNACTVGDFDGDRLPDLAVLATEETLWGMQGARGRVYLFLGRQHWPKVLDAAVDFALRVDGHFPKTNLLFPLLADVNGDGRADLITGWRSTARESTVAGELGIWWGGRVQKKVTTVSDSDVVITRGIPAELPLSLLAATDLDADGMQDLILAGDGAGQVSFLYGRRDWKPRGSWDGYGPVTLFRGGSIRERVAIGDWNADRLPELLFAVAGPDPQQAGQAWLLQTHLPVTLDVRPAAEPNILYLPQGLLVVRVLSSATNPGQNLDPATIRLQGALPQEIRQQDFNDDGMGDVQAYFRTEKMVVSEATRRVTLTGRARNGLPVAGSDSVVVIKTRPTAAAATH